MTSTDVANMALGMIGQSFISAIDDGGHVANQCQLYFNPARDACLRDHFWNFAKRRVALGETDAPESGFAHAYLLPADCVRVTRLNLDDTLQWQVEGKTLTTDQTTATIEYMAALDPDKWDAVFLDAFTLLLASKLALGIKSDSQKSLDLLKMYQMRIADAKAIDGQEQGMQDQMIVDDLTDQVRNG